MANGVMYQLTGMRSAPLLAVSLVALRKVYGGPIAIAVVDECREVAVRLARELGGVECIRTELLPQCSRQHFTAKGWTYLLSPFARTVYLDCDTVPLASLDRLFNSTYEVAVVRMSTHGIADNTTIGRFFRNKVERPLSLYGPACRQMVTDMIAANVPILNTGVVSYRKGLVIDVIHAMTLAGRRGNVDDEMVVQMLAARYPHLIEILPMQWNMTFRYSGDDIGSAKILHFHRHSWAVEGVSEFVPHWHHACDTFTWLRDFAPTVNPGFISDVFRRAG